MNEAQTKKVMPKPKTVLAKAAAMPLKADARVNIAPYFEAIGTLRELHYSFGEIATWLSKVLNAPVKRGQVYHIWRVCSLAREAAAAEKEMQKKARIAVRELDKAAAVEKRAGNVKGVRVLRKMRRMTIKAAKDLDFGPLGALMPRKVR